MIPVKENSDFVYHMEQVLDVYKRPYNPAYPVICGDESPKQLIGEMRQPIAMKRGKSMKYDSEYVRNGVCNIFMMVEPLAGQRYVSVTTNRKRKVPNLLQDLTVRFLSLCSVVSCSHCLVISAFCFPNFSFSPECLPSFPSSSPRSMRRHG